MQTAYSTKIQFKYSMGNDFETDKEIFETRSFPKVKRNADVTKLRELGNLVGIIIGADDVDNYKTYLVSTDEISE